MNAATVTEPFGLSKNSKNIYILPNSLMAKGLLDQRIYVTFEPRFKRSYVFPMTTFHLNS